MKHILIKNPKITKDHFFSKHLGKVLKNNFKYSALWIKGVDIFTDIVYESDSVLSPFYQKTINTFTNYISFFTTYINLILYQNNLAASRKRGPYNIFFQLTIDVENSKAKIYVYLDSSVYGFIAGTKYTNFNNILRASFPIFSTMKYEVEMKLFTYVENENKAQRKNIQQAPVKEEDFDFSDDDYADETQPVLLEDICQ